MSYTEEGHLESPNNRYWFDTHKEDDDEDELDEEVLASVSIIINKVRPVILFYLRCTLVNYFKKKHKITQ